MDQPFPQIHAFVQSKLFKLIQLCLNNWQNTLCKTPFFEVQSSFSYGC